MVVTKKIMEVLKDKAKLSAKQIAVATETKEPCVKTTVYFLYKKNRLLREKIEVTEKVRTGPRNVYVYSLPDAN
jgi:hypothetical protein